MSINVNIVDQRVRAFVEEYKEQLPSGSEEQQRSSAFVLLCMRSVLDLDDPALLDALVVGGDVGGFDVFLFGDQQ